MSDESQSAPSFNTLKSWKLSSEGNVQYRAKIVSINNAENFVSICKYTKAPDEAE